MKKKLLSLTAALITTVFLSSAFAQTPNSNEQKNDKVKCEHRYNKKGHKNNRPNIFESMNLTDTQKAQLKALNEKKREQQKAARQEKKRMHRQHAVAAKRQYLQEVKEIIGTDNYILYLENIVVNQPNQAPTGPKFSKDRKKMNNKAKFNHKAMEMERKDSQDAQPASEKKDAKHKTK